MKPDTVKVSRIHYQKVLLNIGKSMVRLQRPDRLLKVVTRHIEREHQVTHSAILVRKTESGHYLFADSKGASRIPPKLIKFESDHPLVRWFHAHGKSSGSAVDYLSRKTLGEKLRRCRSSTREEMKRALTAMDTLRLELVIPAYYKRALVGLLLLGPKKNGFAFARGEIGFFQILTQDCSMALKIAEYHRGLLEKNRELKSRISEIERLREKEQKTYYEIVHSLAREVYEKDAFTFGHLDQVEKMGLLTAKALGLDLSGSKRHTLSAGLLLHDVGKIGIPDQILNKPSRLSEEEWQIMKGHVDKGVKILEPLTDFREVVQIVQCHHEHMDGSGYPRGLKGDQIPLESRIVAVVDAFHAIITNRCYSAGKSVEEAFAELRRCSATQFDGVVVEAFIKVMKESLRKGSKSGLNIRKELAPVLAPL